MTYFSKGPTMLSISQKEAVLRKAGVVVLPFPVRRLIFQERFDRLSSSYPSQELEADVELEAAVHEWKAGITALYDAWESARGFLSQTRPQSSDQVRHQATRQVFALEWDARAEKLSRHLHGALRYPELTGPELTNLCEELEKTLRDLRSSPGVLA